MRSAQIVFLGAGNMACAIVRGLVTEGYQSQITLIERDEARRQSLQTQFEVPVVSHFDEVEQCDILVLAIKPHQMQAAIEGMALKADAPPLVVSVALGWTVSDLALYFKAEQPIVRAMPNTPAMVQAGATGLYANQYVSKVQHDQVEFIFRAVGIVVWLEDEPMMDAVTAISGSGPAYFFYLMECMYKEAMDWGLDEASARCLVAQTAFGAGKIALERGGALTALRSEVTSKGGSTEAAIQRFMDAGFSDTVHHAMQAARERGEQLASTWRQPRQLEADTEHDKGDKT